MYTAEMKNDRRMPLDKKRARVEAVMAALALTGCQDVLIGDPLHRGVSGEPPPP